MESEKIIDQIVSNTRNLLETHWGDVTEYRNGADIKVAFNHRLGFEASKRTVRTEISFSSRVRDSLEESFDLSQLKLGLEEQPTPRGRRTRKTVTTEES